MRIPLIWRSVAVTALLGALQLGCGSSSSNEARMVFGFIGPSTVPSLSLDRLRITVYDGMTTRAVSSGDFHALNGTSAFTFPYPARQGGTLQTTVAFVGADTLVRGDVTVPYAAGDLVEVDVRIGKSADGICVGCSGRSAFPLRASAAGTVDDSLFVVWVVRTSGSGGVTY